MSNLNLNTSNMKDIFIINKEHVVPKLPKKVKSKIMLESLELKKFDDAFTKSIHKLYLKLIEDIALMEYVIGVLDNYKIDTKLIKNSSDLSPLRLLFNEVIVALNEYNFSINANFNDNQNEFITPYHIEKNNGFLSFDYFNFIKRYRKN